MDQDLSPDQLKLTKEEADEVLRRFREEEEELQQRMEANALNPTVADLAEGLGVPAERVARILSQVREQPAPLRSASKTQSQEALQSDHKTAWIVAVIVFGVAFLAIVAALVFGPSQSATPQSPGTPPVSDAVAPPLE